MALHDFDPTQHSWLNANGTSVHDSPGYTGSPGQVWKTMSQIGIDWACNTKLINHRETATHTTLLHICLVKKASMQRVNYRPEQESAPSPRARFLRVTAEV
jgi:hypothetical protein